MKILDSIFICQQKREKIQPIITILVFCFFIFMMVFNLMHSSLWGDEWVEYYYSQSSILNGEMYSRVISTFQPPLYNFVMHFWLMISDSIVWFRLFNVFVGLLSGIFYFLSLRELYNCNIARLGLIGLAACYQWVYCIQECSEYTLMLFSLFGALYFFIKCHKCYKFYKMFFFVLFCVMAMYSQYGAAFVVGPILFVFYFANIFSKRISKDTKIRITITYILFFISFALPLYFSYLRIQLANNQIATNSIDFSVNSILKFPIMLGKIIGYLFSFNIDRVPQQIFWSVISVIFIVGMLIAMKINKGNLTKRLLLLSFVVCCLLHFVLVEMQIYAMVHPGVSAGFYSRYSYFYIPFLCVIIPIVVVDLMKGIAHKYERLLFTILFTCIAGIILANSIQNTLKNWNKSYANEIAEVWLANEGWKEKTFLFGTADLGAKYLVSGSNEDKNGYTDNMTSIIDYDNLPEAFWAWRTDWDGDGWQIIVDKAKASNYIVDIYINKGTAGQLAHCYFNKG